jgi:hypothetical protein
MKIQYFTSDLSAKLGIGEIKDMHIDTVNGRLVLRIDCDEKPLIKDEYRTVKATKKPTTRKKKPQERTEPNSIFGKARGFLNGLPGPKSGSEFERRMFG